MKLESKFLGELDARELTDESWLLLSDFSYQSRCFGAVITVPAGFVTDFASVPRLPLAYLAAGNTAHKAAVIHDWLYQTHLSGTRSKADSVFLEAAKVSGIAMWRRTTMYIFIRAFGGSSWGSGPERYVKFNGASARVQPQRGAGATI